MSEFPDAMFSLIVTSPPYNVGKSYEQKSGIDEYLAMQDRVIGESVRLLDDHGSICWQVGNYVRNGEIVPIDTLLSRILVINGLNCVIGSFGISGTVFTAKTGSLADMKR